jgi:hypothetical protein
MPLPKQLPVALLLIAAISSLHAQRTTTHNNEMNNNTTGCATLNSSHVGVTSCQAAFPGAQDDSSAGTDNNNSPNSPIFNQTVNTVAFDAAPGNIADFTFDGVDIHHLVSQRILVLFTVTINRGRPVPAPWIAGENYLLA